MKIIICPEYIQYSSDIITHITTDRNNDIITLNNIEFHFRVRDEEDTIFISKIIDKNITIKTNIIYGNFDDEYYYVYYDDGVAYRLTSDRSDVQLVKYEDNRGMKTFQIYNGCYHCIGHKMHIHTSPKLYEFTYKIFQHSNIPYKDDEVKILINDTSYNYIDRNTIFKNIYDNNNRLIMSSMYGDTNGFYSNVVRLNNDWYIRVTSDGQVVIFNENSVINIDDNIILEFWFDGYLTYFGEESFRHDGRFMGQYSFQYNGQQIVWDKNRLDSIIYNKLHIRRRRLIQHKHITIHLNKGKITHRYDDQNKIYQLYDYKGNIKYELKIINDQNYKLDVYNQGILYIKYVIQNNDITECINYECDPKYTIQDITLMKQQILSKLHVD